MIALPLPTFQPRYAGALCSHLPFAYDIAGAVRPSLLVEVGTTSGESYFAFCQSVVENGFECTCYGVRSPGVHDSDNIATYNATNYASFSYLMDGADAPASFSKETIGLLHICASEYVAAKSTYDIWLPKVKPGGVVLIEGIADRESPGEAWLLWEYIRAAVPEHFAFHHGLGLGALRKPGTDAPLPSFLQLLFKGAYEDQEYVRRHYVVYSGYTQSLARENGLIEGLRAKIDELRTEVHATHHERMILEAELKQLRFDANNARRTADKCKTSLATLQTTSENTEKELREEVQRLEALLASEREVIRSVMGSLSWRVTAPLRDVVSWIRDRKR